MYVTVFKDYLAGRTTAEQVKAEVARRRQGMTKPEAPYSQPNLAVQKWRPPSIFEKVTIAQATGQISRTEADDLLAKSP